MSFSIRDRQISAVKTMLNLGKPLSKKTVVEPEWKILIYDDVGQNIISPLLSVAELRSLGITLYLPFKSSRDQVPDVAAVYFVSPTEENISRLCKDMEANLYDTYYFNFISAIPRRLLEDLATSALNANAEAKINKIFDQYIDFVCLEKDMFLPVGNSNSSTVASYYNLNKANMKDHDMMFIIDGVVNSLYCLFVTLGTIPIIRCPSGNAAEMVAQNLDKRLRENLRDTRNSFFSTLPNPSSDPGQQMISFQRPLLLLVDRNIDLSSLLHHTWTYQALVHDVLDLKSNNVTIVDKGSSDGEGAYTRKKKPQSYNMGATDKFWQSHKGDPFPEVAEAVQTEIEEYKGHEEEVQQLKSVMGLEGSEGPVDISGNTAKLTSAMTSLPELLEKKRLIDMHTTIATSLLGCIKERKLDEYFEMEEKIMSKAANDKQLIDFLSDPSNTSTNEDKIRLFLIYYIHHQGSDLDEQILKLLTESGCDMSAFQYLKRWKQFTMPTAAQTQHQHVSRGGGTKTIGMFSNLMSTGSQLVMEGVKNLVIKKHNLPVTKILDQLMDLKSSPEVDSYKYFDPKLARAGDSGRKSKAPFTDAIVFVVGGGNYIEYHNLMEYAKGKPGRKISYGCSELVNANQFLDHLTKLGQEQS